jgi:hypothetical protein
MKASVTQESTSVGSSGERVRCQPVPGVGVPPIPIRELPGAGRVGRGAGCAAETSCAAGTGCAAGAGCALAVGLAMAGWALARAVGEVGGKDDTEGGVRNSDGAADADGLATSEGVTGVG